MSRLVAPAALFVLALAVPSSGFTQESSDDLPSPSDLEPGWNASLNIGGNASFTSQQGVVGQTDGTSALLGLSLSGETTFVSGDHEWVSSLAIDESFARTASLPQFVKNNDSVELTSMYQYYFADWAGVYGRGESETSLFATNNVTGSPTDYRLVRNDGSTSVFGNQTSFRVTDPLAPTSFDESAGAFLKPVRQQKVTVAVRSGVAARQTLADGARVVDDSDETPEVDVEELSDVVQGGFELFAGVSGEFPERQFSYQLGATGFLPLFDNDDEERSPTELARIGVNGKLTFQAFDWLGASYGLKVVRDPQLVEATQVTNNFLLNLSYTLVDTDEEGDESSGAEDDESNEGRRVAESTPEPPEPRTDRESTDAKDTTR